MATLLLGVCGPAQAQISSLERPTVAVLEFDYGAVKVQWPSIQASKRNQQVGPTIDALQVGKGIANLLVAELANSAELRLIERERIVDVAREKHGGGDVRARYLVMGAVTKFGGEQKTRAGASQRRGFLLGGLGGRQGIGGAGVAVDSADFQATLLGEATVLAVKNAADKLRMLLAGAS